MINLSKFPLVAIIDSLPQNRPIYKDSGLWQVRSDDMEQVLFQQSVNQTFEHFIRRYAESVLHEQETDEQVFLSDLLINASRL